MIKPNRLSLKACYTQAWKAFAKWWIPICLLAGVLIVFQLGPQQLAKAESSALSQTIEQIVWAFEQNDLEQVETLVIEFEESTWIYAGKVMAFMLYALPFAAILSILLLCISIMAVKNHRTRYPLRRILLIAAVNLVLAVIKMLLLFLFLPLGFFIYIKLYFVSLLMLEEDYSPSKALQESWHMTTGNFGPLFGMVAINGALQLALTPTLVGLVPATGFATTARAAAYSSLHKP